VGHGSQCPEDTVWEIVKQYVDTVVYAAFFVVYAALLYELVAVFIPFLRPFKREPVKKDGANDANGLIRDEKAG
jgi:hypothetical protein